MRSVDYKTLIRVLTMFGAALALAMLALGTLVAIAPPARAGSQAGLGAAPLLRALPPSGPPMQSAISIVKSASTGLDPANGATVADGGVITYTITVHNNNPLTITHVTILDVLPTNTLDENSITCLDQPVYSSCVKIQNTLTITDPITTTSTSINVTTQISWTLETLKPGEAITRQFKAAVICRPDGYSFQNGAVVSYDYSSELYSEVSNPVQTTVRVSAPSQNGHPQFSRGPTWCSTEAGGAYDMDWGDYDGDGDLDLALGSTQDGALVYRNDAGKLIRVGRIHAGYVLGVRWADFNNDGKLDILVTGDRDEADSPHPSGGAHAYTGHNYIYQNTGSFPFPLHDNGAGYTFQSSDRILRAAPADYDGDGDVDIAAANDVGGCTLALYRNINPANLGTTNDIFQSAINWSSPNLQCLITDDPVYSLAWGDYNNDGLLDLAAGGVGRIALFTQVAPNSFTSAYVFTDFYSGYAAYDLAWGNYDGDGDLDLAVVLGWEVRVYRNLGGTFGTSASITIPTGAWSLALDWADFNGDGKLELAVADVPPKIYDLRVDPPALAFQQLPPGTGGSQFCFWGICFWLSDVRSIRGIDADNDGDMDLAFSDFAHPSRLYTTFAPFLDTELSPVDTSLSGTAVAWGDEDGVRGLDFLLGATAPANRLYHNDGNGRTFALATPGFLVSGRAVALGDVNGDRQLDVAFGRNSSNQIYLNGSSLFPDWWSQDSFNTYSLSFGDFDQDNQGWLDLVAGNKDGPNTLYLNQRDGSGLDTASSWPSGASDDTRSVAGGYYDGDVLPDLAVANYGGPTLIYRNDGYQQFVLAQTLPAANTQAVAWGDYDGDGDMDLAVGNYNQPNAIYENQGGTLNPAPVWTSPDSRYTTSLAWGDWDNDGDLDLAVGNENQRDQVFANFGSTPGAPNLFWLWESKIVYDTQSVAWGDADADGDLDLAIAASDMRNGFYKNGYVMPAHLENRNMPLPFNSSYVSIQPPVPSSGPIWQRTTLGDPASLSIPISFRVYDPDGPNQNSSRDDLSVVAGPYAITPTLNYMYSVDGGGSWQPTTRGTLSYDPGTRRYLFEWQAGEDLASPAQAASDDVRFRISTAHQNKNGRVQRARTSAVSPPFRVRNLSCVWPEDAWIVPPSSITAGVEALFEGWVAEAGSSGSSGQVFFSWDFGDGNPPPMTGWLMPHIYETEGTYVVTLTVTETPCPVDRSAFATTTVTVRAAPTAAMTGTVYLPLILKSGASSGSTGASVPETGVLKLDIGPESPAQVTGLVGGVQPGEGTSLRWNLSPTDEGVLGYRIYRSSVQTPGFRQLAEVPATASAYTDQGAACGYAYFVTAYNAQGESLPSTSSYYSLPCR